MRNLLLSIGVGALCATPALSSGGIYCDGVSDPSVSVHLTVGRVPGFPVVGATITAGDKAWGLPALEGREPVEFAQGAITGDFVIADFTDAGFEAIVASLRLAQADTGAGAVAAGILSIPGVGAWPVVCEID